MSIQSNEMVLIIKYTQLPFMLKIMMRTKIQITIFIVMKTKTEKKSFLFVDNLIAFHYSIFIILVIKQHCENVIYLSSIESVFRLDSSQ